MPKVLWFQLLNYDLVLFLFYFILDYWLDKTSKNFKMSPLALENCNGHFSKFSDILQTKCLI